MYKRLKKVTSVIIIMISLVTLFGPAAFADETSAVTASDIIMKKVDKTNEYVFKAVEFAVKQAEIEVLKENNSENLDVIIDKIIEKLLEKTESKVDKLIQDAAEEGIEITKTYVEVVIYDRTILVDPCYAH
jgi:predicted PurR-regulated permease PerM